MFFRIFKNGALVMAMLFASGSVSGQQATITVLDAMTQEKVSFAHICFESLKGNQQKHAITDINGQVTCEISVPAKIAISYVGYETFIDTINNIAHSTFYLRPAVFTINEVVVTAQYSPARADKSIYKVNVINSRQIEQKAAANLNDLLANEANMRVAQGGVLGSSLSMQGLTGENVKFLIDGVPVIGRLNGNIDLNQLNLYNVDHIEVIEGPMSVIYGSNALAGVVNIITKENRNTAISAFVESLIESVGVFNFDGGIGFRKKRSQFSVDAARNFFDGFSTVDTSRSLQWKPRRQYNTNVWYLFSGDKTRIKITGQYFNELLEDKGPLMEPYRETAFDNYFTTVRATGKAEASYQLSQGKQLSLVTAFSSFSRVGSLYFKDLTTLNSNLLTQDTTAFNNYLLRAWLNEGTDTRKFNYQAGLDINNESGSGDRISGDIRSIGDYALFTSFKYDPATTISIQPGIRFIYNTKYKAPLVYSLNLKWSPTNHTTLRTSFARGFRSPSLKELYLSFVDINHNVWGNPNLKAEYSYNANIALNYQRETGSNFINFDGSLFYNNVENLIELVPLNKSTNPPVYGYINVGRLISEGGNLSMAWNLYPDLTIKAGIAVTGRHIPNNGGLAEYDKNQWNRDVTTSASYKLPVLNVMASVYFKRTGKYLLITEDGYFDGSYIDAYNNMDISLARSLISNKLNLSIGCKNIFDVTNVLATGNGGNVHGGGDASGGSSTSVAWGRSYFLRLAFNFNKYK